MTDFTQERLDYDLRGFVDERFNEYMSNPDSEQEWCHYIFGKTLGIAMWPLGDMILTRLIMNVAGRWMIVESTLFNACYANELSELYRKASNAYIRFKSRKVSSKNEVIEAWDEYKKKYDEKHKDS